MLLKVLFYGFHLTRGQTSTRGTYDRVIIIFFTVTLRVPSVSLFPDLIVDADLFHRIVISKAIEQ